MVNFNIIFDWLNCSCCLYILGFIVFIILVKLYVRGGVCRIKKDMSGKVIIVTGANIGIGKETARVLAEYKAEVILACRSKQKALPVVEEIKKQTKNSNVHFMELDLGRLDSVHNFAKEFRQKFSKLDILILNAGIMGLRKRQESKEGFELHFATNYLGHFLLANELYDVIKKSNDARILTLTSLNHNFIRDIKWDDIKYEKNYNFVTAYNHSKLANVMFACELQKRSQNDSILSVSINPGSVRTNILNNICEIWYVRWILTVFTPIYMLITKSSFEGAQTTLYCALEDRNKLKGGEYYADCKIAKMNETARNDEKRKKLWEISEKAVKLEERLNDLK